MPDALKRGLRTIVAGTPYVAGAPLQDRVGLIADVDRRIADTEREHASLVDEAGAHGVTLAHLQEEVGHRTIAAQKAERERRDALANERHLRREAERAR
jgi:hypothetical protein